MKERPKERGKIESPNFVWVSRGKRGNQGNSGKKLKKKNSGGEDERLDGKEGAFHDESV